MLLVLVLIRRQGIPQMIMHDPLCEPRSLHYLLSALLRLLVVGLPQVMQVHPNSILSQLLDALITDQCMSWAIPIRPLQLLPWIYSLWHSLDPAASSLCLLLSLLHLPSAQLL